MRSEAVSWIVLAVILGLALGVIVWVTIHKLRRLISGDYSLDQPRRKPRKG